MDLTDVPADVRAQIVSAMETELNGGEKTGFELYMDHNEMLFDCKWALFICKRNEI